MADVDFEFDDEMSDYSASDADFDDEESDFDFEIEEVVKPKKTTKATKAKATTTKAKTTKSKPAAKPKSKAKKTKAPAKKAKVLSLDSDDDADADAGTTVENSPVAVLGERSTNVDSEANVNANASSGSSKPKSKKTVEETYKKMSQVQHILLRPDTYIGSAERVTQPMWVLHDSQIIQKEITFTPGLYKIYDEILVNAADNKQRDPSMDKLEIDISQEDNLISVKNNGKGLPIVWHNEQKCYVPTLVFGHLLTGSNFDDNEKKTTGGRNGYGAKLANIFSHEFKVECGDSETSQTFSQTFRNNMKDREEPIIKKMTASQLKKGDYVKISFRPDLTRFKMDSLDDDAFQLLSKRAYDIAGSMANRPGKKLAVTLNGKKVPVKKFENYLELYKGIEPPAAYECVDERWEVGISVSDGTFQQVSFVNAISTSKGGEHVNYIADQVAKELSTVLGKKNKGNVTVKPAQIKNYINVFVNCLIDNPSFDSQTKEFLTTKKGKFGSKCTLSKAFLKKVEKSGIVEKILAFAKFKEKEKLGKKGGRKVIKLTGITKLDDANFAGSAKSKDCTLILTEGDSAKSLAMSGISVVGRDYYGVFPLKGKPLNVREASLAAVMKNAEIKNVIDIMGLKFGVEYDETNIKTLRYGHLMIMADQDHDGSHIKGLVINFIHHFWPSLLDVPGFLQQFITPIVKATKGKQSKTFFTLPEYEAWKESTGNDAKGWKVKYYKGLGTSTSAEAKAYFSNLPLHEVTFCSISADEAVSDPDMDEIDLSNAVPDIATSGSDLIEMAFSKNKVDERKTWLNNLKKNTYLDYSEAQIEGMKFSQFINRELILFSQADNIRSIPNIFDGFKPSQRKVLFGCILRNLKTEMKVAQLSGFVGEKSAYHHGEVSLQGTIVNMAQDFVGSNNVNLLTPSGQFGTRRMGGKDSASPRYIFTKLEKITRAIFHPDDDALLTYLHEDGDSIEPEFYMPVIPMVLVNGAEGIGTGWSTGIPNFNPREIIANLRRKIKGEEIKQMHPHYFGFDGAIEEDPKKNGSYIVSGKIERVDDETLLISELPIKTWTQDYKQFIEKMMTGADPKKPDGKKSKAKDAEKIEPEIKDFKENHTDTTVSFTIVASKEQIDEFEKDKGLYAKFKLTGKVATSNMNVFDEHNRIIKFSSAGKILDYFYNLRLEFYVKRKEHMLDNMRRDQRMLSNKARFIEEVCTGDLIVSNRKRTEILADLKERGYDLFPKQNNKTNQRPGDNDNDSESDSEEEHNSSDAELAQGYEYLLGMKIWSLTFEKAKKLKEELAEKTKAVSELEATPPTSIWESDLDTIETLLDDRDQYYAEAEQEELAAQNKSKKNRTKKKAPAKKRPAKKVSTDDSSDEDFVVETKKTSKSTAAKKPVAEKAPAKAKKADPKKPTAKKAPPAKKAAPKKIIEPVVDLDSDSDSDSGMTLMERMRKKDGKSSSTAKISMASKKRPSPRTSDSESEELDSFDPTSFKPAALTPAPKKSKANRSKVNVAPINLDEDSEEEKPLPKPATKARTARSKNVQKEIESEDEYDEDVLEDSDEDSEQEEFVPAPRARSTRGRKRVTYVDSDSSDDDFFDD